MSNFPELSGNHYVFYNRVMYPLAQQHERKIRKDYGTKRGRHSTSASFSSAFDHPSSSHYVEDDNDEDDEGTSRVNTLSPTSYLNSLSDDIPQVFTNPPHDEENMETLFTRQTKILNQETNKKELFTHKEEMNLETAQTTTTAKLLILKQGEYDMWRLRIEQYFQVQDYALWDVIENGNSFKPVAQTTTNADGTSTSLIPGLVTTEENAQKKNDVKGRSMLLMALPNEHLMKFNQYKDAKTLFAAIQQDLVASEDCKSAGYPG
ncbi:hypothetical protein Tco_1263074 [Tanacetum coccineum]